VGLLRDVGDRRALAWLSGYLDDSDSVIQVCGASVLDHLLFLHLIEPEEAEELLKKAEHHENGAVREQVQNIRNLLPEVAGNQTTDET
jgi:hypothetical protein